MRWTPVSRNLFNQCWHFAYGDAAMGLNCIYIYICVCVCVCIYIFIYMALEKCNIYAKFCNERNPVCSCSQHVFLTQFTCSWTALRPEKTKKITSKKDQCQMMQMPTGADQGQPRALCAPQKCDAEWCKQRRLQVTPEQKQHAKEKCQTSIPIILYKSSSVQIYLRFFLNLGIILVWF